MRHDETAIFINLISVNKILCMRRTIRARTHTHKRRTIRARKRRTIRVSKLEDKCKKKFIDSSKHEAD